MRRRPDRPPFAYINLEPPAVLTSSYNPTLSAVSTFTLFPLSQQAKISLPASPYLTFQRLFPLIIIIPFFYQRLSNNIVQLRLPFTVLLYRFRYSFNYYGRALFLLLPYPSQPPPICRFGRVRIFSRSAMYIFSSLLIASHLSCRSYAVTRHCISLSRLRHRGL